MAMSRVSGSRVVGDAIISTTARMRANAIFSWEDEATTFELFSERPGRRREGPSDTKATNEILSPANGVTALAFLPSTTFQT